MEFHTPNPESTNWWLFLPIKHTQYYNAHGWYGRKSENITIYINMRAHTHTHTRIVCWLPKNLPKWYGSIDEICKMQKEIRIDVVCDPCCFFHSPSFFLYLSAHCSSFFFFSSQINSNNNDKTTARKWHWPYLGWWCSQVTFTLYSIGIGLLGRYFISHIST